MKNAVIGVVLAGFVAWVGVSYFGLASGPAPWELFLPDAVLESDYGWILVLLIPALIWLVWDRFRTGK